MHSQRISGVLHVFQGLDWSDVPGVPLVCPSHSCCSVSTSAVAYPTAALCWASGLLAEAMSLESLLDEARLIPKAPLAL